MVSITRRRWIGYLSIAVLVGPVGASQTEERDDKGTRSELTTGRPPTARTVEVIMEQAVRNIAARYNLNEAQTEKTRALMKREVERFLKDNEETVWPVIRDLIKNQFRNPEDQDVMRQIGESAGPLSKLAQKTILTANDEWRDYLTPEQKQVHDYDLREMGKTFEKINGTLDQWADGVKTDDPNLFPPPPPAGVGPRPPKGPRDNKLPDPVKGEAEHSLIFEKIVEQFIEEYELDKGQITSARSILDEYKAKANDYTNGKKQEITSVMTSLRDAHTDRDLDTVRRMRAERKRLYAPVYALTDEMGERLRSLLTTAQIQRHAERQERPAETRPVPKRDAGAPGREPDSNGSESD